MKEILKEKRERNLWLKSQLTQKTQSSYLFANVT